jgi:hypothetical protein
MPLLLGSVETTDIADRNVIPPADPSVVAEQRRLGGTKVKLFFERGELT